MDAVPSEGDGQIVTEGFAHEGLRDAELLGQLPGLGDARLQGVVELHRVDEPPDGPAVSPVFVLLPQVTGGVAVIEAAGQAEDIFIGNAFKMEEHFVYPCLSSK